MNENPPAFTYPFSHTISTMCGFTNGTKAIGAFPDGQSALMLVCARLRHVAATSWGARRYMNMDHLFKSEDQIRRGSAV